MTSKQLDSWQRISGIAWQIVENPNRSDRQIAEEWGFTRTYINKIRMSLIIKDGNVYRIWKEKRQILCAGVARLSESRGTPLSPGTPGTDRTKSL